MVFTLLLTATVLLGFSSSLAAQGIGKITSQLEVRLLAPEEGGGPLLVQIKNTGNTARLICVRTTTYQIGSGGGGQASPHQCRSDANFVLVLRGESHFIRDFQSFPRLEQDSSVAIDVTAVIRPVARQQTNGDYEESARWKGVVRDARNAFREIAR
jgi:hypothetical protein